MDGIIGKPGISTVEYSKDCSIRDSANADIPAAVAAARRADIAIVVVGGSSARDFKTDYAETGAAVTSAKSISDMESGEGFDRDKTWASQNADALFTAWYPDQEGANGIADVLFGDYSPSGRLPISIPRNTGQIPVYYNKKNPGTRNYVEMPGTPLYTFGYGLSYTKFEYSDLQISQKGDRLFEVSFAMANTGDYDGEEVAQLYLRDDYASVVQAGMQLKNFEKVFLKKGEKKRISFMVGEKELAIARRGMKSVVEKGTFSVMVGGSSDLIKLRSKITVK